MIAAAICPLDQRQFHDGNIRFTVFQAGNDLCRIMGDLYTETDADAACIVLGKAVLETETFSPELKISVRAGEGYTYYFAGFFNLV